MVTEFKVIVSAVILNEQKQVLLGKRSEEEEVFPGLWGIPGGKVEAEATGIHILEETLQREAKEEMGIEIAHFRYLESSCRVEDGKGKLYIIFSAIHTGGTPQPLEDTTEVRWENPAELDPATLTPHTLENIQQALSLLP